MMLPSPDGPSRRVASVHQKSAEGRYTQVPLKEFSRHGAEVVANVVCLR